MFANDVYLIVSILQNAFSEHDSETTTQEEYVKKHASEIKDAGRMFKYLGLAVDDDESPLGWKATPRLFSLIAKRASKRASRKDIHPKEGLLIELMHDAVFGGERHPVNHGRLGYEALMSLGLICENHFDDRVVAPQFTSLFYDAYDEQRAVKCARARKFA